MQFRLLLAAIVAVAVLNSPSGGHPDHQEDRLLFHFASGLRSANGEVWRDMAHHADTLVVGNPRPATIGPTQALRFDGLSDVIQVQSKTGDQADLLPRKEFSVATWVLLRKSERWGGICGILQDNGGAETGWLLGYNDSTFTFAVSSTVADDGDGQLTYLSGTTPLELNRWYYVVGTYDGERMRIYVDGKLDAESTEQSGDVLYPERGQLVIGAYQDDDEQVFMDGAIFELKAYARAITPLEIAAEASQNENLLNYREPEIPTLQFLVKPYLQWSTPTSMTVMCETNIPSRMEVHYSQRQPMREVASSNERREISTVTLDGLEPHTTYYYRVICRDDDGNELESDVSSLQTSPGANMPWSFAILGDTQRNPSVTRACADGAFALRPNFVMHCGDVVDDGFAKNQWLKDLFEPCSRLLAHVPMFPVIGNHEQNSHWYYDYFHLPPPEYYYTFHYGNAQFFMIDSNKPLGPGSEQAKWLEKELAASNAVWKFTCHHHPCYSSDEDDYGNRNTGGGNGSFTWGDPNAQHLIPLYERYGVDIAFNGHIHVYERTWPILEMTIHQKKGVRYITSGGAGGSLETPAPQKAWFSLHVKRAHHFCYATVHDRTIQFKAYDIDDKLFDVFELTKDP